MKKWILAANALKYDHKTAFKENGYVDWYQTRNFEIGDIVYIYCTKPISKIQYKTVVSKVNQTREDITDDSKYWQTEVDLTRNRFFRLSEPVFIDSTELSIEVLNKHGLRYAPQSPCIANEELASYIETIFGGKTNGIS